MTDPIALALNEIKAGWTWVKTEAADVYNALKPLVEAPLKLFQQVIVNDLWGAAAAFVQKLMTAQSLVDLETAFLNTLEHLWPNLLSAAQTLGSALLQSLLGIFQAKILPAA